MSRVSVIMPNYNRADLIGQTIKNLLRQSQPPMEIIVVDDGSTDDSVAVIRSFGAAVTLLQQNNQGPGAARNAGLQMAKGDYIQFQDSDDLLSLNKLEVQSKLLDASGSDIVFGPWAHVFIRSQQLSLQTCVLQQALPPKNLSLHAWLARGWFTVFQSLLFRRSFLLQAGGYEADVRYGEDMEFLQRLLLRSPKVAFAADTLTLYRVNSTNNLSSDAGASRHQRIVDWAGCLVRMERNQQNSGQPIDGSSRAFFLTGARKHLRYLKAAPEAPLGLVDELCRQTAQLPAWYLGMLELWQRGSERWRLMCTGYRWMPGLQAGPLTSRQRQMIADLGFSFAS